MNKDKELYFKEESMFLCLYKKRKKYTFLLTKNVRQTFNTTNEQMKVEKWTHRNKIASFPFNSWEDFKAIKNDLKPYGLRMYVAECKAVDKTYYKLIIELMHNPLYQMVLSKKEEHNPEMENNADETAGVRLIELWDKSDWDYMEKEFDFKSYFWKNLFIDEKEIN